MGHRGNQIRFLLEDSGAKRYSHGHREAKGKMLVYGRRDNPLAVFAVPSTNGGEMSEWISVKDEVPSHSGTVIGLHYEPLQHTKLLSENCPWRKAGYYPVHSLVFYADEQMEKYDLKIGFWKRNDDKMRVESMDEITHWMELPRGPIPPQLKMKI